MHRKPWPEGSVRRFHQVFSDQGRSSPRCHRAAVGLGEQHGDATPESGELITVRALEITLRFAGPD